MKAVTARRARFEAAPLVGLDTQDELILDVVCLKVELQAFYGKGLAT